MNSGDTPSPSTRSGHARESNPFSTRWTQPGAIAYEFPPGLDAAALIARLQASDWQGAIIGPHGSGKSTLLAALSEEIQRAGRGVARLELRGGQRFDLRGGQRRLDRPLPSPIGDNLILVIDGFEQLGWWRRFRLRRRARRERCGLLVTAHSSVGLPEIFRTETSLELLTRLVARLPPHGGRIQPADLARAFASRQGNLRDALFDLYDLYEQRR